MKKILITTLLISASAFALAVNAQEVFETQAVQEEPISIPAETVAVDETTDTVSVDEQTPAEDVGGPQNIVNIPTEQTTPEEVPAVEQPVEATQEVTLSVDEEIRKDGEEKALKIFNAIDVDGNGSITQEEFLSFHSKLIERKLLKSNIQTEATDAQEASETSPDTQTEVQEAPAETNE